MKLQIGSLIFDGFESAHVFASIDSLFDQFQFVHASASRMKEFAKVGESCEVISPDGETMITGFIYGVRASIGGGVNISGADKTADLADSTVAGTGEFKGLTAKQIVQSIAAPFGITVSGEASGFVPVYRYNLNSYAADVIRDVVSRHGLLANSDGAGNITLMRATERVRSDLKLIEGGNITSGHIEIKETRHSAISFLGQNTSTNSSGYATGGSERHRPRGIVYAGNLGAGQAATSAAWAKNLENAEQYIVNVAGLNDVRPNQLIDIESQTLGIAAPLLIRSVQWSVTKSGVETVLTLVNPALFGGKNEVNEWML